MTAKGKDVAKAEPVDAELLPICKVPGCGVVGRTGEIFCDGHAGEQRILAARRKLANATPEMAQGLIDLATNAASEETRRRATEAVLDRAGLRPGVEIEIVSSVEGPSVGDVLRERLALLRTRTLDVTVDERDD